MTLQPKSRALLLAIAAVAAAQVAPVTLMRPTTPDKSPAPDGFIQRWLVLEPIPANGLTDSAVQAIVKKEYFPNQSTVTPHDGDKVIVDLDKLYQQDKDSAEWKSAFIQV